MALLPFAGRAATNELSAALQTGLFEEEANRNLPAAIEAYEKVAKQFDQNRALAATAIFRLGEVNRKLGRTNEAAAFYQRILREFTDQDTLAKLSQQNLAGMGMTTEAKEATTTIDKARGEGGMLGSLPAIKLAALNQAEAEAAALEAEVKQLLNSSAEDRRRIVELNHPNPVLTKLLQDLASAQQQQVILLRDYSPEHPNAKAGNELIGQINKQIDAQLFGVVLALESKRDLAVARAKFMRERVGEAPATQLGQVFDQPPITAVLDEEEAEIRRIQAMIQNSPDLINAPSGEEGTPLYQAASKGQLRVAAFLLDHGADVNTRGVPGTTYGDWTPLFAAANHGHKAMVELLASRGASVDAKVGAAGGGPRTALQLVALIGFQAVAEALVERGANVNAHNEAGDTPLHFAAQRGNTALAAFLITQGAEVNATNSWGGTALMAAATDGRLETVQKLLAAKAVVNAERTDGRTALSLAAEYGHLEIVKALLAAKADPNASKVNLPLHCAIKSKSAGIVEALLEAGADANRACKVTWDLRMPSGSYTRLGDDIAPLAIAMAEPQLDVVKLLLAHEADPNGKDILGKPLVFSAVNNAELMKALLDAGAKTNVDDGSSNHRTPLSSTFDPKVISLLLAAGADPEARVNGYTALMGAVALGRIGAAEALLKGGASVKAATSGGMTPLHMATGDKNQEMIKLLLDYKADVNARDNQGLTPLDYAKGKHLVPPLPVAGATIPVPARTGQSSQETGAVADLLRQHGGRADLPKLDRIEVTRPETGYRATAFLADTNGWNQFTLAEVLAQQCQLLSARRSGSWQPNPSYYQEPKKIWEGNPVRFPDLARVKVHRFMPATNMRVTTNVDLTARNEAGRIPEVPLQMGDVVEVPEADHPVTEVWTGLNTSDYEALCSVIARTITIMVNEKSTNLTFTPRIKRMTPGPSIILFPCSFMLRSVLDESKLIRSSSDLTRVKVTRRESANAKPREWVVDCSDPNNAPDLWLRDGDVIEVPEK